MLEVHAVSQARAFFENGWRGVLPWCVIEQVSCVHTEEEFDAVVRASVARGDGWLYGLWRHQLLHARLFGTVASQQIQEEIVGALAAWPAERRDQFEVWERGEYERLGWPPQLIEGMRPSGQLPLGDNLPHPGLLVVRDDSGTLHVLGSFIGSGVFLPQVVHGPGFVRTVDEAGNRVEPDLATLIMLLISCPVPNANPAPEWPLLIRPFCWRRLRQLRLHRPDLASNAEMATLLLRQVPSVIASLRERPPRKGMASLRSVLRSRLVEAASIEAMPDRRRRGTHKWRVIREADDAALERARLSPLEAELADALRADPSLTPAEWARRKGKIGR